jgi:hypothetical protein
MTAYDRQRLDQWGYLVFPAHLAISREILSHLETLFERAGENAGHELRAEPFARTLTLDPSEAAGESSVFAPLLGDHAVLACVEHLLGGVLGRGYELAGLRARSSNPFALALNPFRLGPGASACEVFWLLDDFTDDGAAALRVVSGSHLMDPSLPVLPAVSVAAAAGSAVVLDGRLLSGGAANPGNRHLRTLRCQYVRRAASNSG